MSLRHDSIIEAFVAKLAQRITGTTDHATMLQQNQQKPSRTAITKKKITEMVQPEDILDFPRNFADEVRAEFERFLSNEQSTGKESETKTLQNVKGSAMFTDEMNEEMISKVGTLPTFLHQNFIKMAKQQEISENLRLVAKAQNLKCNASDHGHPKGLQLLNEDTERDIIEKSQSATEDLSRNEHRAHLSLKEESDRLEREAERLQNVEQKLNQKHHEIEWELRHLKAERKRLAQERKAWRIEQNEQSQMSSKVGKSELKTAVTPEVSAQSHDSQKRMALIEENERIKEENNRLQRALEKLRNDADSQQHQRDKVDSIRWDLVRKIQEKCKGLNSDKSNESLDIGKSTNEMMEDMESLWKVHRKPIEPNDLRNESSDDLRTELIAERESKDLLESHLTRFLYQRILEEVEGRSHHERHDSVKSQVTKQSDASSAIKSQKLLDIGQIANRMIGKQILQKMEEHQISHTKRLGLRGECKPMDPEQEKVLQAKRKRLEPAERVKFHTLYENAKFQHFMNNLSSNGV